MAEVLTKNQTFASPSEALAHHGVKGMKWGVRKDDKGAQRETKAKTVEARVAKANVRIAEINKELDSLPSGWKTNFKRNDLRNQANQATAYRDGQQKKADAIRDGRLTPNQKRLLIGGAVVGGLALATVLASKQQSGEINSIKLRGEAFLNGNKNIFKRNDALAHAKTPDEVQDLVVKGLNPNYKSPGGQMNCRRCTFAYELRRRGFDVDATASSMGYGQSETGLLNALTPGQKNVSRSTSLSQQVVGGVGIRGQARGDIRRNKAETFSIKDATDHKSVLDAFSKQPDGARGEAVFNFGGFGHSLAWERFGSKTYIFDTQKGQRYSVDDLEGYEYNQFLLKWGHSNVKDVQLTRLDNLDLDHKFLSRWATNRKGSA